MGVNKYNYLSGVSVSTFEEIKTWEYGILLLQKEDSRGIDTRFQKDALVLIIAKVDTYQQYMQMLGRGSRTRGVCDGILYVASNEKASVVMDKLKRQNYSAMTELEHLMKLLEKRSSDKQLVTILKREQDSDNKLMTLAQIEVLVPA
jgi:hypothetical protein